MFAALIGQCHLEKRPFVRTMLQTLAIYLDEGQFDISVGWGGASIPWQSVDRSRMGISMLNRSMLSVVNQGHCIVGSNAAKGAAINVGETFATASHGNNNVTVETTHDTVALSVQREAKRDLWLGWYRDKGVDVVLVHEWREAIEAATGRCGCLFDEQLQMWLVPHRSVAVHEMGTRVTRTIGQAYGSKAETPGS